jgi:hypothetical protein
MGTMPNIRQIEDGIIAPSVAPVIGQVPVATGVGNETEWQDADQISGRITFAAGWTYALSTTIIDPSSGNLRTDAAPELSTIMAISVIDSNGFDTTTILDTLSVGDFIVIQDNADPLNWVKYSLSGAVINNTTWYEIPITVLETGGTLVKGSETFVRFAYFTEPSTEPTVDSIQFNTSAGVSVAEGQMAWNANDFTLDIGLFGGSVLQVGQELPFPMRNETGSTITNGQAVFISAAQGDRAVISLAQANMVTSTLTIGVATQDISDNGVGLVTTYGYVRGIDTSAWTEGDELWLSATVAGGLTNVRPIAPDHIVHMGIVIRVHATVGFIFVNPISRSGIAVTDGTTQADPVTTVEFGTNFVVTDDGSGQASVDHDPAAKMNFDQNTGGFVFPNTTIEEDSIGGRFEVTASGTSGMLLSNEFITNFLTIGPSDVTLGSTAGALEMGDTLGAVRLRGNNLNDNLLISSTVTSISQQSGGTISIEDGIGIAIGGGGAVTIDAGGNGNVFSADDDGANTSVALQHNGSDVLVVDEIGTTVNASAGLTLTNAASASGIGFIREPGVLEPWFFQGQFGDFGLRFRHNSSGITPLELDVNSTNGVISSLSGGGGVLYRINNSEIVFGGFVNTTLPAPGESAGELMRMSVSGTVSPAALSFFGATPVAQPVLTSGTQEELTAALGSTSGLGLVDDSQIATQSSFGTITRSSEWNWFTVDGDGLELYTGGYTNGGGTFLPGTPAGTPVGGARALTTQTSSNASAQMRTDHSFRLGLGPARFRTDVSVDNLSDGTETYEIACGMLANDFSTVSYDDEILFRYTDSINSGNWVCASQVSAGGEEITNTNVAPATGNARQVLEIVVNTDATEAEFYIDGVLVATHTEIPTRSIRHGMVINKLAGTTGRYLRLLGAGWDYVFDTPI